MSHCLLKETLFVFLTNVMTDKGHNTVELFHLWTCNVMVKLKLHASRGCFNTILGFLEASVRFTGEYLKFLTCPPELVIFSSTRTSPDAKQTLHYSCQTCLTCSFSMSDRPFDCLKWVNDCFFVSDTHHLLSISSTKKNQKIKHLNSDLQYWKK